VNNFRLRYNPLQNANTDIDLALQTPILTTWDLNGVNESIDVFENGNGVDYPFLNDAHYPFSQILFLQSTPFSNINQSVAVTAQPIKDLCE
jgi:hypothetical protein